MAAIALIPARGGSKRFPRKNIAPFLGRPVIAYSIEAAWQSGLFERVVVSTEDEEIALVASQYGGEAVSRPLELSGDTVGEVSVCLEFLQREEEQGRCYDTLCCLYATAPMRHGEDIRQTMALLEPGVCDFAMAVTTYDNAPNHALRQGADGFFAPAWPQDLCRPARIYGEYYVSNGSTYAVRVAALRQTQSFYGPNMRAYVMPRERSVDINVPLDMKLAEFWAHHQP